MKISTFIIFFLFIISGLISIPLHANESALQKECFTGTSFPFRYCVYKPESGKTNGDIAYYLHGKGLSENTYEEQTYYTGMIQAQWKKKKVTPPTVVAVSFGPIWLLTKKATSPKSGLMDVFKYQIIPEVEKRLGKPKSRILFGESMGGLNSLAFALNEGHLFKKVASLCPPVYSISPFSSGSEVEDLIKRTNAEPKKVYEAIQLAQAFIATEIEWENFSPIHLIEKANPKTAPKIYLSCGRYDYYGNYEGNELLAQRAQERGFKIKWRPLYGGHCDADIISVADFIAD